MSNVVRTYPKHPPMVTMQGARPWNYQCTWIVECDGRMPGAVVIEYGRQSASGIPIPAYGSTLNMTVDGSIISDNSVYALDFATRMVGSTEHQAHVYEVDVTWREPNSNGGGVGVNGEHPDAFPYRDQPTLRPPEVWIEYETIPEVKHEGRNLQEFTGRTSKNQAFNRTVNTLGAIVNANGEMLDPVQVERTVSVLCAKSYVSTYETALSLNASYENTVNSDTFLARAPHFVKFRRAETGYPEYYNGQRYYEMIVRVDISLSYWYHKMPNEGTYYYDTATGKIKTSSDDEGRALSGRFFPLDLDGQFRTAGPYMIDYLVYSPVPYAGLVQYFT